MRRTNAKRKKRLDEGEGEDEKGTDNQRKNKMATENTKTNL